ncbi:BAG family molecular chaperone regulator 3-like isoform X2 [Typha latifolia]|uniref:BAG family molecular chaperone regulator 3-like isoform X2 n=1 Tax=Typha latifolia TaxID=4733 RepID=UPI003C2B0219
MVKLRPGRLFRCYSNKLNDSEDGGGGASGCDRDGIEWEMRPGGMLVQKRECGRDEGVIQVRVSTGYLWHDISIRATSTFGELKVILALVSGLKPTEQRLIFRGKEREDSDHLHMVGVEDKDKVLLMEDPAIKERKLRSVTLGQLLGTHCHNYIKV